MAHLFSKFSLLSEYIPDTFSVFAVLLSPLIFTVVKKTICRAAMKVVWVRWGGEGRRQLGRAGGDELCVSTEALFRCKKFLDFDTVALSFLFDKYCPIIE